MFPYYNHQFSHPSPPSYRCDDIEDGYQPDSDIAQIPDKCVVCKSAYIEHDKISHADSGNQMIRVHLSEYCVRLMPGSKDHIFHAGMKSRE